jgi:hypothetical protein
MRKTCAFEGKTPSDTINVEQAFKRQDARRISKKQVFLNKGLTFGTHHATMCYIMK